MGCNVALFALRGLIGESMKQDIKLSTGRIVSHRPYLSNGKPNGATEAFIVSGGEMTEVEGQEYCQSTMPKPRPKPTWAEIKASKAHISFDLAVPGQDRSVRAS